MAHPFFNYRQNGKPGVGYNRKGYSHAASFARYKRTGFFRTVKGGSGHEAGYKWGNAKNIDPNSPQYRYSKNSPSFDEGVYLSKRKRRGDAVEKKMTSMVEKML